MNNKTICRTLAALLCLLLGAAIAAEPSAVDKAKQALDRKDTSAAISILETAGKASPDVVALLYTLYLAQDHTGKATPLFDEAVTRWPKSEALWQMTEAYLDYRVKANQADLGIKKLDEMLQRDLLPAARVGRAKFLRLQHLLATQPERGISEALPILLAAPNAHTLAELEGPVMLARIAYLPCMKAGRFDDARTVSTQIQEKLALMGAGNDWFKRDMVAYFDALAQAASERFTAEFLPVMKAVKIADRIEDLHVPMTFVTRFYGAMMKQGRYEEAKALSLQMHEAYRRVGNSTGVYHDQREYYRALCAANHVQFINEALPWLTTIAEAKDAVDLDIRANVAMWSYGVLQQYKRPEDAAQLHEKIRGALTAARLTQLADQELATYYQSMDYNPALALHAAPTLLSSLSESSSLGEIKAVALFARSSLYLRYMQAGRPSDAAKVHELVQALLLKVNLKEEIILDDQAYLLNLTSGDPKAFLAKALPTIDAGKSAKTPAEAEGAIALARGAYGAMMKLNQLEDASNLHAQMQELIARFGKPHNWLAEDDTAYQTAVKNLPATALDPLFMLFKRAAGSGDTAAAKRWIEKMETLAPGHPRTEEAKTMLQNLVK